jgi:hypothetical protein
MRLAAQTIDLEQNFSKQVFGYFLAAKSDKEKKICRKGSFSEKMPPRYFCLFHFSMMIPPRCGLEFCTIPLGIKYG